MRIRDYDGENSSFGLPGADLTAGNFAAQVALWDALRTAIEGIIIGNQAEYSLKAVEAEVDDTNPASQYAQRELKWLVGWTNTSTGEKHTTEIATPDLTLLVANSQVMNTAAGAGAQFVTDFEAVVRGGVAGTNLVTVDYVRLVGRNI